MSRDPMTLLIHILTQSSIKLVKERGRTNGVARQFCLDAFSRVLVVNFSSYYATLLLLKSQTCLHPLLLSVWLIMGRRLVVDLSQKSICYSETRS